MRQAPAESALRSTASAFVLCSSVLAAGLWPSSAAAQYWFGGSESYYRPRPRPHAIAPVPRREHVQHASADTKSSVAAVKPAAAPAPYPMMAVISIGAQRVTFYDKTGAIMHAPVSTGQAGHRTPLGIFSVIQKERYHESNIYSGAPMPYMQRITWSGIAMHEGVLPGYPASHGCIRMPGGFASKLYGITKIGMRVVIAPHDVTPSAFSSADLFEPVMLAGGPGSSTENTASGVKLASGEPASDAAPAGGVVTQFVNPQQRAIINRTKTKAAHSAAILKAKAALEASQSASADANQAQAELRNAEAAQRAGQARLDAVKSAATAALTPEAQTVHAPAVLDAETVLADANRHLTEQTQIETVLSKQAFEAAVASREADEAVVTTEAAAKAAEKGIDPVSVFISRKEGKLFVRQGFEPMLEVPVAFKDSNPLGTHLFQVMDADEASGHLSWTALSVPNTMEASPNVDRATVRRGHPAPVAVPAGRPSTATEALSRVEIPQSARQWINERIWVGASVIVSDLGISEETGKGTDFVVLTK